MKRNVIVFGLISGGLAALFMLLTVPFLDRIGFDKGLIVGYTGIIASLVIVFFGIRSYRENIGGGAISFGRAFAVGILITVISCCFYVITWEIIYFFMLPDFMEKYGAYAMAQVKAAGATQQVIDAKLAEMKQLKAMLDNPLINAALTFTEPFPIGLIITLISAAVLRRKPGVKGATGNALSVDAGQLS